MAVQKQTDDPNAPSVDPNLPKPVAPPVTPPASAPYVPKIGMGAQDGGVTAETKSAGMDLPTTDPTTGGAKSDVPPIVTPPPPPANVGSNETGNAVIPTGPLDTNPATSNPGGQTIQPPAGPDTTVKTASNGAQYTGPQYYQPDPSKPDYQPNTALPWAPSAPAGPPIVAPPVDSAVQAPPNAANQSAAATAAPSTVNAGNVEQIDPANDLRSSTILPGNDPALEAATAGVQNASSSIDNFDRQKLIDSIMQKSQAGMPNTNVTAGPALDPAASARTLNLQGMLDTSAAGLSGVDRNKMAQDLYQQFVDSRKPQDILDEKQATDQAAATGGLRSGRLRTSYGDLSIARENARNLAQRGIMSDALNASVQDQLNKTNALSGLEGQSSAQDAQLLAQKQAERGYTTDVNTGNVDRGLGAYQANRSNANSVAGATATDLGSRLNANRAVFGDISNESRAQRNEVRGERSNENDMANQAFQRRLGQYNAQQAAKNTNFNQGLALTDTGDAGNPANTLEGIAAQSGGMSPAAIAQLASGLGRAGYNGGSTAPPGATPNGAPNLTPQQLQQLLNSLGSGGGGYGSTPSYGYTPSANTPFDEGAGGPDISSILRSLQPNLVGGAQ